MGAKIISVVVILLGLTFNSFSQDVDSTFKSIRSIDDGLKLGGINSAIINAEYNGGTYFLKYEYDRTVAIIYLVYPPPPAHYDAKVYVYNGKEYIYVGEGTYSDDGCCTDPLSHIKKAINQK